MRKIKGLVAKKSWAKRARKAQFELMSPECSGNWSIHFCGIWAGCCAALGNWPTEAGFGAFFNKHHQANFWWPDPHRNTKKTREAYTARIIALESFALYCEEHGV